MKVLVDFMCHQQRKRGDLQWWFNPRQKTLMAWINSKWSRVDEKRRMCRATLNRWLAGLEAKGYINREKRNWDPLTGKVLYLASKFTFGRKGQVWIKENPSALADPLRRLYVSDLRNKVFKVSVVSKTKGSSVVGKAPTTEVTRGGRRAPLSADEREIAAKLTEQKSAALRRRTSSSTRSAARPTKKAPSRKGARPASSGRRRRTVPATQRKARGSGSRTSRRLRRS